MYLRLPVVDRIVRLAIEQEDHEEAMIYLLSYVFLLRVRNEALPVVVGAEGAAGVPLAAGAHSCVSVVGDELVLRLASRKNMQRGSVLRAGCWCAGGGANKRCCPTHVLGPGLVRLGAIAPCAHLKGALVMKKLRQRLSALELESADLYRLQDFRRGHARDLQESGATLPQILKTGQWRTPAVLAYIDPAQLEADMVTKAHIVEMHADESRSDED